MMGLLEESVQRSPSGTVGRHDGSRMLLPDHLEAPSGVRIVRLVEDQAEGSLHGPLAVQQNQVVPPVPVVLDESQVGLVPADPVLGNGIEDLSLSLLVPTGVPHAVLAIDFQDGPVVVDPRMVRISRLAGRNNRLVRVQGIGSGAPIDRALSARHEF